VAEEPRAAPAKPEKPAASGARRGKRNKTRKRSGKKARPDDFTNDLGASLEERLARRDEEGARRHEVRRGLRFLATGLLLIVIGVLLTWLLAELAKGGEIERGYGWLTVIYKVGGIWGPLIVCGIGGLIPCAIGILNLIGIGVVVEERDS
jgi:hypothetical protein